MQDGRRVPTIEDKAHRLVKNSFRIDYDATVRHIYDMCTL